MNLYINKNNNYLNNGFIIKKKKKMLTYARVDFKKPNIEELGKKGFTLADMHLHSRYSDGMSKVKTILKKSKRLDIGISITDHNEIKGCVKASENKEVMLIPGIETTTYEGIHMLFYFFSLKDLEEFYKKYIERKKEKRTPYLNIKINEIIDYTKNFNCIISAAHPFAPDWTGLCKSVHKEYVTKETMDKVPAIEVMTGSNLRKRNLRALEFAHKSGKAITAGSDAHSLREVGGVLTYTKQNHNLNDFLESILKHKNFIIGKELMLINKALLHTSTLKYPVKNPFPLIKRSISYMKNRNNH